MREAIAHVQPTFVVWENVRGALSAAAASDLESDPRLLGGHPAGQPVLRALGRVLGDLADLGFDAEWRGLRASEVGACHQRFRIFVLAWRRDADIADAVGGFGLPGGARADQWAVARRDEQGAGAGLTLPTPRTSDTNGAGAHGSGGPDLRTVVADLLPTPRATRGGSSTETLAMLPTPKAGDADFGLPRTSGRPPERSTHLATRLHYTDFGQYADAIARQEAAFGHPAPPPTEPGKNRPRLSAEFASWMMGLPAGWITDVPGVTRNEALRMAGNGVVPQQAAAALRDMLPHAIAALTGRAAA